MPSYESLRDSLKTGDVVLFSGKGVFSNVIKLFSGGKWSHVGMVLRVSDPGDSVLLWESTTLNNVADIESGQLSKGVQLVPLSQRIAAYDGEVTVRHLAKAVSKTMLNKLHELRISLSRRPYERRELEMVKAAWDGLWGQNAAEDLSSVFCSELVAEAFQVMGLLPEYPKGMPSNEYTPLDFSSRRSLPLPKEYGLSAEIPIL